MAREIPEVVRAAAGLAATVLDEARKLPETLPGIPVRVIGLAMQQAMKVQQQYAGFVARGDELFTGTARRGRAGPRHLRRRRSEPVTVTQPGFRDSAFDRATAEPTSAEPLSAADGGRAARRPGRRRRRGRGRPSSPSRSRKASSRSRSSSRRPPTPPTSSTRSRSTNWSTRRPRWRRRHPRPPRSRTPPRCRTEGRQAGGQEVRAREARRQEGRRRTRGHRAPETTATPEHRDARQRRARHRAPDTATPDAATPTPRPTRRPPTRTPAPTATTDAGGSDTAEADAAIAQGAAIDAVGEASAAPTDEPAGRQRAVRLAGRGRRADRRLRQLHDRAAARPSPRLRAAHRGRPRRLRGGDAGPRPLPADAAQPAGEGRGAGGRGRAPWLRAAPEPTALGVVEAHDTLAA